MVKNTVVYLVVHELFGILYNGQSIILVTPVVDEHQYRIARFKDGAFQGPLDMARDERYSLHGVVPRTGAATAIPSHPEFSPNPPGTFSLSSEHQPFCRWELPQPKQVHQLRQVSIPEKYRPLFTGDPHGDAVDAQLSAISLVQVIEYEQPEAGAVAILDHSGRALKLDYTPDKATNTINLHLWAQRENESDMDDDMANAHARKATAALVALFDGLKMEGKWSLSVDNCYSIQTRMPDGIRFAELMTLAEKFTLRESRSDMKILCTVKSCGHGANVHVNASPFGQESRPHKAWGASLG
jgi:hypothetical protein